eukprot:SAG31_NODE_7548_length_1658_cov_1.973701_1_plen_60_part_10
MTVATGNAPSRLHRRLRLRYPFRILPAQFDLLLPLRKPRLLLQHLKDDTFSISALHLAIK